MKLHIAVILLLLFFLLGFSRADQTGRISGNLKIQGGKEMEGLVFFFNAASGPPPSPGNYWRVPDHIAKTDSLGNFSANLPAGRYYLGAIQKAFGQKPGPPHQGDYVFYSTMPDGRPQIYEVKKGGTTDLGALPEAVLFKDLSVKKNILTGIEGKIRGEDGEPLEGIIVFAFLNPELAGKPLYASDRTGRDGGYLLGIGEGGKYFLRARDIYGGGVPVPGAYIGLYGDESPKAVEVKTGAITKGIDITVRKFKGRMAY